MDGMGGRGEAVGRPIEIKRQGHCCTRKSIVDIGKRKYLAADFLCIYDTSMYNLTDWSVSNEHHHNDLKSKRATKWQEIRFRAFGDLISAVCFVSHYLSDHYGD